MVSLTFGIVTVGLNGVSLSWSWTSVLWSPSSSWDFGRVLHHCLCDRVAAAVMLCRMDKEFVAMTYTGIVAADNRGNCSSVPDIKQEPVCVRVCELYSIVIRPPGTLVPGSPYVLLQMFFFSLATRSPSSVGRSPRNFVT